MSWHHNILGEKRQWKNVVSSRRIRHLRVRQHFQRCANLGHISVSRGEIAMVLKIPLIFAGDSFNGCQGSGNKQNGRPFSTFDKDNDAHIGSCAKNWQGGYWYYRCGCNTLNSRHCGESGGHPDACHMLWYDGYGHVGMNQSVMMMRRN